MKTWKMLEKRNLLFLVSAVIVLIGVGLMANRALHNQSVLTFGIDFTGGSSILIKFDGLSQQLLAPNVDKNAVGSVFTAKVRQVMDRGGVKSSSIQMTSDKEILIKAEVLNENRRAALLKQFEQDLGTLELLEVDMIGPSVGAELRGKSLLIVGAVMIALLLYITWRFQFAFGVGALASLAHDTCMFIALASIFHLEINTEFVAALLTVLGYSLNDTIVVFDRVRENLPKISQYGNTITLINQSIMQTFSRTINTVVTVLLVISALLIFGGSTIKPFSLVLFIGVLVGTYSSIFIASPVLYLLLKRQKTLR